MPSTAVMNLKDYKAWTPHGSQSSSVEGVRLSGWRYAVFVTAFVGLVGLAIYPTMIAPMRNTSKWKEEQEENRKGIVQEDIQPGGMRVWSDPFQPISNKSGKEG